MFPSASSNPWSSDSTETSDSFVSIDTSDSSIAVTTAINMCARGEVSLLLWGNWTLPPVQEGPPLMRGGSLFAGGELRVELRTAQGPAEFCLLRPFSLL